jgi:hypothetical protein
MSGECKPVHNSELSPLLIDTIGGILGFPSQSSYEARHRQTAQPPGECFPQLSEADSARRANLTLFSWMWYLYRAGSGIDEKIKEVGQLLHESIGYKRPKLPSQLSVFAS